VKLSIFSVENDSTRNQASSLADKILYVTRAYATSYALMYGAAVSINRTAAEMVMVKENFGQTKGKGFFHYILSPEDTDECSAERLFQVGCKIAEAIRHFDGYFQVLMAVHQDSAHLHAHFIVNNIDYTDGHRMDLNIRRLVSLKQRVSNILVQHGISPIRMSSFG
jgi:hypothetical protein